MLLVIDQFEQWLHRTDDYSASDLTDALRQCDGVGIQCLLVVRDDFWMAITRFLAELDVALVQGHNLTAVEPFDRRHAEYVLSRLGEACGAITPELGPTPEQREFLKLAIAELAEDERIPSVKLSLFVDIMKAQEWRREDLESLRGRARNWASFPGTESRGFDGATELPTPSTSSPRDT